MQNVNSQAFKTRDATSYDSLAEQFDYYTERLSHKLAAQMVALAEIAPNDRVLDVGTGTGVVALQAANIVGEKGMIDGIDLSDGMLETANNKAVRLNLEAKINFSRMDAEALEFDEQTFNKVVSLFALLHFPNPLVALKEIFRVMRSGGTLVLAVGSSPPFSLSGLAHRFKHLPDFVQRLRGKQLVAPYFLDSLVEEILPRTREAEESQMAHHSHNRTQPVAKLIEQTGFEILKTDWHGDTEIIESPEEFWEIQRTFSSIARKRINDAAPEKSEFLYSHFLEKCRQVQASGGKLVYPFGAFYVVAQKPR